MQISPEGKQELKKEIQKPKGGNKQVLFFLINESQVFDEYFYDQFAQSFYKSDSLDIAVNINGI